MWACGGIMLRYSSMHQSCNEIRWRDRAHIFLLTQNRRSHGGLDDARWAAGAHAAGPEVPGGRDDVEEVPLDEVVVVARVVDLQA